MNELQKEYFEKEEKLRAEAEAAEEARLLKVMEEVRAQDAKNAEDAARKAAEAEKKAEEEAIEIINRVKAEVAAKRKQEAQEKAAQEEAKDKEKQFEENRKRFEADQKMQKANETVKGEKKPELDEEAEKARRRAESAKRFAEDQARKSKENKPRPANPEQMKKDEEAEKARRRAESAKRFAEDQARKKEEAKNGGKPADAGEQAKQNAEVKTGDASNNAPKTDGNASTDKVEDKTEAINQKRGDANKGSGNKKNKFKKGGGKQHNQNDKVDAATQEKLNSILDGEAEPDKTEVNNLEDDFDILGPWTKNKGADEEASKIDIFLEDEVTEETKDKQEAPKQEAQADAKQEAPKQEAPKQEAQADAKQEAPKQEAPKQEAPKQEAAEQEAAEAEDDVENLEGEVEFDSPSAREEKLQALADEYQERYQRLLAEFENARTREAAESAKKFDMGAKSVLEKLLPVVDNFERALQAIPEEDKDRAFEQGVDRIYKQLMGTLSEIGVSAMNAEGTEFNPDLHNAVMHVEDEELGENVVAEEMQKGYMYKDSVLRFSMVKVAN